MAPPSRFLKTSLRTKVLVPVITVMVLLLAVTLFIVNLRFQRETESNSRQELDATKLRFQHEQIKHQNSLKQRFQSLAREPHYVSAFRTLDANTIQSQLGLMWDNEMLAKDGIAFVCFARQSDPAAENFDPILQPNTKTIHSLNIAAEGFAVIQLARQGEPATDTVSIGDKLYNIVAIPIFSTARDQVIGVLAFGEEMGWNVAQEFSVGTGGNNCTALLAGNRVIATTLPGTNFTDAQLLQRFHQLAIRATKTNRALDKVQLEGKHYFCSAGKFPSLKGDNALGYLLFTSYEDQLAALAVTQDQLLIVSLFAILSASLIVWFFVQRATAPLLELRDSAEAVGRGDFSRRVAVRSHDECGELAIAFNRMTENVQQSQAELQKTVDTLKNTQAQLIQSEKLSAVGEFVAGVAHELNNPLAAVMGFSEMLKDADVGDKHRRHLDLVFKAAQRCQKIVQSLLSFARRHQPERKPVSVNNLVEEVLEIVAYQLRTSNVEVVSQFAPELPLVLADGHQIQQVILNLVNNARQAMEANQAGGRITISTELKSAFIQIRIQDNGPGIAPENLSRIFDPFFTTKEVGKGTGLGLSLCYGLVKEHGGNITVTSEPGSGAAFTVELPASEEVGAAAAANSLSHGQDLSQEGTGKKILLVDDEEMLLEMLRDGLQRHGYAVVTASNGEIALRELQAQKFDAIGCDIKMPGLNGRQLYERIRAGNPEAAQRFVFMTGDIINESLQLFLEHEHIPCLNKPFTLDELRRSIQSLVAGP